MKRLPACKAADTQKERVGKQKGKNNPKTAFSFKKKKADRKECLEEKQRAAMYHTVFC